MDSNNFFDLWGIFVNELIGDFWLFAIIGIAIIAFISLKYRMPFQVTISFCVLWGLVLSDSSSLIYTLVILAVGLFFYIMYSRLFRRG